MGAVAGWKRTKKRRSKTEVARRQGRHSPAANGGRVWRRRSDTKRCPYFLALSQPERRRWWCLDFFWFSSGRRRRRCFSDVSLGVAFWGDVQVISCKQAESCDIAWGEWTASAWIVPRKKSKSRCSSRVTRVADTAANLCPRTAFFAHRPDHEEGREKIVVVRCGSSISSQSPGLTVRTSTSRRSHGTVTELPLLSVGETKQQAVYHACGFDVPRRHSLTATYSRRIASLGSSCEFRFCFSSRRLGRKYMKHAVLAIGQAGLGVETAPANARLQDLVDVTLHLVWCVGRLSLLAHRRGPGERQQKKP